MSFWNKLQATATKTVNQTSNFLADSGTILGAQAGEMRTNFTLPGECNKAATILESFLADPHHPQSALNSIPKAVLLNAKGLAIFTVFKAGFIFSGRGGTGLVLARLPDGSWSAPSLIATGGVGWGLQVGADVSDFVIVLNTEEALRAFTFGGNVTIGGSVSASAGPIGTGGSVQAALASPAAMFSYSKSKGLFAGMSLEGTVLIERKDANKDFYGSAIPAKDILSGRVPAPEIASRMYEVVEAAEGIDESSVPSQAFIPSADGTSHTSLPGSQQPPLSSSSHPQHPSSAGYPVGGGGGAAGGAASGGKTLFDADEVDGIQPDSTTPILAGSSEKAQVKAAQAPAGEF